MAEEVMEGKRVRERRRWGRVRRLGEEEKGGETEG